MTTLPHYINPKNPNPKPGLVVQRRDVGHQHHLATEVSKTPFPALCAQTHTHTNTHTHTHTHTYTHVDINMDVTCTYSYYLYLWVPIACARANIHTY